MTALFFIATLVLYFAGTVFFLTYLLRRSETLSNVSLGVTGLGFLTHTIALISRMAAVGCESVSSCSIDIGTYPTQEAGRFARTGSGSPSPTFWMGWRTWKRAGVTTVGERTSADE